MNYLLLTVESKSWKLCCSWKTGLSVENVVKRLEWAHLYKDWTIGNWEKVMRSDEFSIWIGINFMSPMGDLFT